MSPSQWLIDYHNLSKSASLGTQYFNLIDSFITNGNESIIKPQLKSHQYHMQMGCSTLRTMTEFITPSLINKEDPQRLEHFLRSSIFTGYHCLDKKANTFEGLFGGVSPVEIAANIGPLIGENNIDKDKLYKEYNAILNILAPSFDVLWIQNIGNLVALEVILQIAKNYKDDEQIWISLDCSMLNRFADALFDLFKIYNVGSIIVVGNDWKQINRNLVLAQEYTEIYGGTKFGVFIDNKEIIGDECGDIELYERNESMNEMDKIWKETVSESEDFDEWNDDLLDKASKFWINEGVSIIGCDWENGLKILKKNANEWNRPVTTL